MFDINVGPIRHTKPVKYEVDPVASAKKDSSPWLMILPIVVLVIMVPIGLYYTGKGDILKGSGSTAVFYA